MTKLKKGCQITSVDDDEGEDPTAGESVNGYRHLDKWLALPAGAENEHSPHPGKSPPRYITALHLWMHQR